MFMTAIPTITFFHAPQTRSSGIATLIEELEAPVTRHVVNMKAGEQRQPAYLAVNPMGKVPALRAGDEIVTEQAAIAIYLADLFPQKGLAPTMDDPLRGPYLRWFVFYGSCFEPAVIDKAMKRDPAPASMSAYGDYDTVIETICAQLRKGPFMLGERFSALDILWGMALKWTVGFKLVPETPEIMDYIARITSRPSFARIEAEDQTLSEAHAKAAGKA
jgi:glutathione S-transferase